MPFEQFKVLFQRVFYLMKCLICKNVLNCSFLFLINTRKLDVLVIFNKYRNETITQLYPFLPKITQLCPLKGRKFVERISADVTLIF